jgi:hypothetical protein
MEAGSNHLAAKAEKSLVMRIIELNIMLYNFLFFFGKCF